MAAELNSIFANTLAPNPVTSYTLFRGVTDYTNLAQFDLYETGYSFLILLQMPYFMDRLAAANDEYASLMANYRHIIEYEFRGAQGIEDITGETSPLQNGITDINIITKVTEQGGSSFSMNYFERSGSVITKTHELFLRGIKDPKTQVKRYNGLLQSPLTNRNNALAEKTEDYTELESAYQKDIASLQKKYKMMMTDKGQQYEIYNFLLIITDNTALNIEKAYILASCQPALANTSIYNVTRGEIQFSEMAVQFNGIPLPGRAVNKSAQEFLQYINKYTCFDEMDYGFSIFEKIHPEVAFTTNNLYTDFDRESLKENKSKMTNKDSNSSTFKILSRNGLVASKIWTGSGIKAKASASSNSKKVTYYNPSSSKPSQKLSYSIT